MFRRLVQNVRNGYPDYLTRPFEVAELYQNLIPYRHNRREMEIDTNGDYEVALCQLLAGERGYVSGDAEMQEAVREELLSPNPNTAIFREFAASRVALSQDAIRRHDQMTVDVGAPAAILAAATPGAPRRSPIAGTQPGGVQSQSRTSPPPASPPRPAPMPPASSSFPPIPPASGPGGAERLAPASSRPPAERTSTPVTTPRASTSATAGAACRYCGGSLPAGRPAVYCPHCGQNLTIQRCPACNTELELAWKHCITCGRAMGSTGA